MATTTLADLLGGILPFLSPVASATIAVSRSSPATAANVQAALTGVQGGIQALAASETAAASKPIVARIEIDAMAVLQAAAAAPLPPPYGTILMVASALLPGMLSAVNTLLATKTTVAMTAGTQAAA